MVSFEKLDSASLIDSIRGALLGKILSGELRPGDRLPAERDGEIFPARSLFRPINRNIMQLPRRLHRIIPCFTEKKLHTEI